jgi:hypothetical protein
LEPAIQALVSAVIQLSLMDRLAMMATDVLKPTPVLQESVSVQIQSSVHRSTNVTLLGTAVQPLVSAAIQTSQMELLVMMLTRALEQIHVKLETA